MAPRGFTLIELLIVAVIIAIIGLIVIAQYRKFDSQLLIRNLAYELALTIREAQSLGVGVRGVGGSFNAAYGVYVPLGSTYTLFRDGDDNGRYIEGDPDDLVINRYTLRQGNTIHDLCVDAICTTTALHIVFERPDPDARFYPAGSTGKITLRSPNGLLREIDVMATGQISVE